MQKLTNIKKTINSKDKYVEKKTRTSKKINLLTIFVNHPWEKDDLIPESNKKTV